MGGVLKYSFLPELSDGFDLSGQSQPDYHNMSVAKSKDKNSGFSNLFFGNMDITMKNVHDRATVLLLGLSGWFNARLFPARHSERAERVEESTHRFDLIPYGSA